MFKKKSMRELVNFALSELIRREMVTKMMSLAGKVDGTVTCGR